MHVRRLHFLHFQYSVTIEQSWISRYLDAVVELGQYLSCEI